MARRRRRRFRWRLKPAGYAFFGIVILLVGLGVFFLVRAIVGGDKKAELAAMPSPTDSIELMTPSPTPAVTPEPTPAATPALDMEGAAETTPDPSAASAGGVATVVKATPAPAKATATPKSSIRKATSAEKKAAKAGYLTGDGVNLRAGPSTDYMSLGKYAKNSTLVVYATDGSFQFVKMDKDGKVGFISKSFVKIGETSVTAPVVDVPTDAIGGKVTAGKVALRDGPSKGNTAITELHAGDQVFVYYKTGDFYYLEAAASGRKGFAYASYVSVSDTVPTR